MVLTAIPHVSTIRRSALPAAVLAAALFAAAPAPLPAQDSNDRSVRIVVEGRGPRFGFQLETGPPPVVRRVMPGSPAEKAGVRAGDVILRVNGRAATYEALTQAGKDAGDGETVRLTVRRDGREMELPVALETGWRADRVIVIDGDSVRNLTRRYLDEARESLRDQDFDFDLDLDFDFEPGEFAFAWPDSLGHDFQLFLEGEGPLLSMGPGFALLPGALRGVRLTELNPDLARHFDGAREGLLVLEVEPDSPAGRAGLKSGDVIVRAGGEPVPGVRSLRRAARGEGLDLTVVRDGREMALRVPAR